MAWAEGFAPFGGDELLALGVYFTLDKAPVWLQNAVYVLPKRAAIPTWSCDEPHRKPPVP